MKWVNSDELWEGGVLGELWEGGELRTEELGTEVEAGCDTLYAAFCAQVWGAEATMDGWQEEWRQDKRVRGAVSVWTPTKTGITYQMKL